MLASVPLEKVATLLLDPAYVRWTEAELLGYMDLAQREIAQLRPEATKSRVTKDLVAGAVQTLAAGEQLLLDVESNVTGNKAVHAVDKQTLDRYNPDWQNATQSATIRNYCYTPEKDPFTFYVDPPAIVSTQVRAIVSLYPVELTTNAVALTVGDEYEPAVINYTMARALSKDAEHADLKKAQVHYASYAAFMGIRSKLVADIAKTVEAGDK